MQQWKKQHQVDIKSCKNTMFYNFIFVSTEKKNNHSVGRGGRAGPDGPLLVLKHLLSPFLFLQYWVPIVWLCGAWISEPLWIPSWTRTTSSSSEVPLFRDSPVSQSESQNQSSSLPQTLRFHQMVMMSERHRRAFRTKKRSIFRALNKWIIMAGDARRRHLRQE